MTSESKRLQQYPKVLIIGQPFNNDTGGGITLTNLFRGWDKDKLAVACSGYLLVNNIDTDICNTYYQLGHKENKWLFPFNYLKRKYYSGQLKFDEKKIQHITVHSSKFRVKIIMNYFYPFLEYIGLLHSISKTELSKDLRTWMHAFNPDIIYMQATSRSDVLFCIAVSDYLQKPLIFHVMDDWPSTISRKGPFKRYWHKKIDRELRILLDKASVLMSISDYMAQEYKIRYDKEFITFHNPVNINFWKRYQRNNYELGERTTILYAGRIGTGIRSSLEIIAKAIELINNELGISIKFVLKTAENPSWINNYKCVEQQGFDSQNEMPRVFSGADFLILPYDFTAESIKYIQYSMPTKAPEYMISGTPIILFAPEVTAIVKYCQKYKCAKVVTENNVNELSKAIKNLIQDKSERQRISQNAIAAAEKNHDSAIVTNEFHKNISSLVA